MLSKLTTTHIIIIAAAVVIIGIFIGKMMNKSVSDSNNGGTKVGKVASNCPTSGGAPCCPPSVLRFNSNANEVQCV